MENTVDNFLKFAAIYIGQKAVMNYPNLNQVHEVEITGIRCGELEFACPFQNYDYFDEPCPILLKSLTDITDDDAIEVARMFGIRGHVEHSRGVDIVSVLRNDDFLSEFREVAFVSLTVNDVIKLIDFLRSRGYSLTFNGVSVSEQISRGWVRIKSKN